MAPTDEELRALQRSSGKLAGFSPKNLELDHSFDIQNSGSQAMLIPFMGSVIRFRCHILGHEPVHDIDCEPARAYAVEFDGDSESYMAITSAKPDLFRLTLAQKMRESGSSGHLRIIDWGVCAWPSGQEFMVCIMERPKGLRLVRDLTEGFEPFKENTIKHQFVLPMLRFLESIHGAGVHSCSIRVTNLYWDGDDQDSLVLGNMVTGYPGGKQDVLFETIERGMCSPFAKGQGSEADDIYAVGATLVCLLGGKNPFDGMSEEKILNLKMNEGSFDAMASRLDLSQSMRSLLRGLLDDDPKERWDLDQIRLWSEGSRTKTEQKIRVLKKVTRAVEFLGYKHSSLRSLTHAMTKEPHKTQEVILTVGGSFENWLKARIEEDHPNFNFEKIVRPFRAAYSQRKPDSILVVHFVNQLGYPGDPLRYGNIGISLDGLGSFFIEGLTNPGLYQLLYELMEQKILREYYSKKDTQAMVRLAPYIDTVESFMRQRTIGFGAERCLYELNPHFACQSDILGGHYVYKADQILNALEKVADSRARPTQVYDRQIFAFLLARLLDLPPEWIAMLKVQESSSTIILTYVRILSFLQDSTGNHPYPKLTSWLGEHVGPVIQTYKNRKKRELMQKKLALVGRTGKISELLDFIDNQEERIKDQRALAQAQRDYTLHELDVRQINMRKNAIINPKSQFGKRFALLICYTILMVSIYVSIIENLVIG